MRPRFEICLSQSEVVVPPSRDQRWKVGIPEVVKTEMTSALTAEVGLFRSNFDRKWTVAGLGTTNTAGLSPKAKRW